MKPKLTSFSYNDFIYQIQDKASTMQKLRIATRMKTQQLAEKNRDKTYS